MPNVLSPGSMYTEEFPSSPASASSARAAVGRFALAAGALGDQLDGIRLATSEAVTNVVQHAYDGPDGLIHVTASYVPDEIWLLISDDGVGLQPGRMRGGLGLGLAVIAQVSDEFQIVRRSTGGTQLQMRFRLRVTEPSAEPEERLPQPATLLGS